jgi:hypothetical protein
MVLVVAFMFITVFENTYYFGEAEHFFINRKIYCDMKKRNTIISIFLLMLYSVSAQEFTDIEVDSDIDKVQPMSGIVFWRGDNTDTDKISLEFSYMLFDQVVIDSAVYDWTIVENYLDDIAARGHQAIFRFRYVYVGEETSVPEYIKARPDYNETEGISEGEVTWFPDWTNEELQRFSLEFYTKFAEKYDSDPRLAFIQVGFGLWGEYHIYDGPFELGVTFPSKEFQTDFFHHLDTTFVETPFSISIDAADDTYSPMQEDEDLLNIHFGLFDDSFMHEEFGGSNTENWNFFDRNRYLHSPAGGEFSYYTAYDQAHVLDYPDGPYGQPFEYYAGDFHISYIIGNDQPQYQTMSRIEDAGFACGYKFKIVSLKTNADSAVAILKNVGIAPIYYDAYLTLDGIRSPVSLKLLPPEEEIICPVAHGGTNPEIKIESDRLVEGQEIQYLGTINQLDIQDITSQNIYYQLFPSILPQGEKIKILPLSSTTQSVNIEIYNLSGQCIRRMNKQSLPIEMNTFFLTKSMYLVKVYDEDQRENVFKILVQ